MIMKIFVVLLMFALSVHCQYDWREVQRVVDQYYLNGAFPGAVLRVANKTHSIFQYEVGNYSKASQIPFTQDTIFDIASLTKVSATLASIMKLYDLKKFSLQDKVIQYIPEYDNNNKSQTTIENLLLHNAGLAPDHPNPAHATKDEIINWTYNCTLTYPIGTKMVYSDLSFILLGIIVQRLSSTSLQSFAQNWFREMEINTSSFLPNQDLIYRIAPTQYSALRKHLIQGQVHDPTAYSFGGVAGHAGFFSTASDLQRYMQIHLGKGKIGQKQYYSQETVAKFYSRVDGLPYQNRRALGWDTVPIQDNPPCGHFFSLNSFGHTGYTGTMMWADRQMNIIIVLLTNRVHPTSLNIDIIKARSDISDKIVQVYTKDD